MSNSIFWENKKKYFIMLPAEIFTLYDKRL